MKYAPLVLMFFLPTLARAGTYGSEDIVVCDIPQSLYDTFERTAKVHPQDLSSDPFIHCARPSQMQRVMDKYFKEDEYWIFIMNVQKIQTKLRYEGQSYSTLYPHVYGFISVKDISYDFKIKRNAQGKFILPDILKP